MLAAVVADPECSPIVADWLDEHDEPELASLFRDGSWILLLFGDGDGTGYGYGSGSGYGYGYGDGDGTGYGYCSGYGSGYGSGHTRRI